MAERSVLGSAVFPLRVIFLMWLVFFLEYKYGFPLGTYGIWPWSVKGLIGIVTAPLIHANLSHLISNTFPLLFLGTALFYFYPRIASKVFFRAYFWTNILVWLFARNANHIGASGLVYGIAFFLIFLDYCAGILCHWRSRLLRYSCMEGFLWSSPECPGHFMGITFRRSAGRHNFRSYV